MSEARAVTDLWPARARRGSAAASTPRAGVPADVTPRPVASADISALDRACGLVLRARTVVLIAHISPDADALGSALALGLGLERRGVHVMVTFADPVEVPESLRSLPGQHLIVPPDQVPARPDLAVSLDVNSASRLGSLVAVLEGARHSLVVDHHPSNTHFGENHLIDASAEATVVVVARMLQRMGIPIDGDIAENIYAGLATDTANFRFAGADAHRLAARLIDVGVAPDELMRPISDTHPFGWLDMLSQVLGGAVLEPDVAQGHGLVWTVIDEDTSSGLRSEELDSVIDIVRTTQEAGVAAVLKQVDADTWQVSLRSRPPVDVAEVATALGGGGHVRAAGFTHRGAPESAIAGLRRELDGRDWAARAAAPGSSD